MADKKTGHPAKRWPKDGDFCKVCLFAEEAVEETLEALSVAS